MQTAEYPKDSQCESKSYTWKSTLSPIEGSVKTAAMGLLEPKHVQSPGRNECIICLASFLTMPNLNQIAICTPFPSDKAAPALTQHSWWSLCHQTSWLLGNRLRMTFLPCSTKLRRLRLDKWPKWQWPTVPLHATFPFNPNPLCPYSYVMNLPLLHMCNNLSTLACLKGVADLFIFNTNATFLWF